MNTLEEAAFYLNRDNLLNNNNGRRDKWKSLAHRYEIFADSFATLYGLQAGFLDKNKAQQLISVRKADDADIHDTSEALSALVESYDEVNTPLLSPQELKKVAVTHAKKFTAM